MPTRKQIFAAADWTKKQQDAGVGVDSILRALRDRGYGAITSAQVLRFAQGISLSDAKGIVFDSPVWADERESLIKTQNDAADALEAYDP